MNTKNHAMLLDQLEEGLDKNQFYLEWQPQIDSNTNQLSGLEALVRWAHPHYGNILPEQFISLFERNAKITKLTQWVLRKALLSVPAFQQQHPNIDISMNLSVYDLMSDQLIPAIDALLEEAGSEIANHVVLEITESVQITENNQTIVNCVSALQNRGFRISIDDFGAGYASFGYLQTLPVDELKIDRRYTQNMDQYISQAIVESIIGLAKNLRLRIVAEGIETRRQQEKLTQLGAHLLQGWRLGRPTSQQAILAHDIATAT